MTRTSRILMFLAVLATAPAFGAEQVAQTVWIDVRTVLEHKVDHIEGDARISHGDIVEGVSDLYPDKSTPIRLYCRSGGRAGTAAEALQDAGYTDVVNAGGIDDARKQRGMTQ